MTEMSVGVRFVANSISPAVYELQSERNWAGNKKEMRKRWKEVEGEQGTAPTLFNKTKFLESCLPYSSAQFKRTT